MNRVRVRGPVQGRLPAMASKSYAHRALIVASGAQTPSTIGLGQLSQDMERTLACLQVLGADIQPVPGGFRVDPVQVQKQPPVLDLGESGSTFRFLLPWATALYPQVHFRGQGRLPQRPIQDLVQALAARGVRFDRPHLPLTSRGLFQGGQLALAGDVSSQYITGLLLAAPLTAQGVDLEITTELESRAYVDMTLEVLEAFGLEVQTRPRGYRLAAQAYQGRTYQVEGDWSNASFFLVAGALGPGLEVTGLNLASRQGDRAILDILEAQGAQVQAQGDRVQVCPGREARPIQVDLRQIPDALPVLAVLAAASPGPSVFRRGRRLRYKESDRLRAVAQMIQALGGQVEEEAEGLVVQGTGQLQGGTVDAHQDHRLVMAATVASLICRDPVTILGAQAVAKSYPHFFEDWKKLGGQVDEE